jgi:hypothetical protein
LTQSEPSKPVIADEIVDVIVDDPVIVAVHVNGNAPVALIETGRLMFHDVARM